VQNVDYLFGTSATEELGKQARPDAVPVFRSTDGGKTWAQATVTDPATGRARPYFFFPVDEPHPWAFQTPASGNGTRHADFWAYEVHRDGPWFIRIGTARRKPDGMPAVDVAISKSLTGPWKTSSRPFIEDDDGGNIDCTFFRDPTTGVAYVSWREERTGTLQCSRVEVSDKGLKRVGKPWTLVRNDRAWEGEVVEGVGIQRVQPELAPTLAGRTHDRLASVFKNLAAVDSWSALGWWVGFAFPALVGLRDSKVLVTYSGNFFGDARYGTGALIADDLRFGHHEKLPEPFLSSQTPALGGRLVGPGHGMIWEQKGSELRGVWHAIQVTDPGLKGPAPKISFNREDGRWHTDSGQVLHVEEGRVPIGLRIHVGRGGKPRVVGAA